MVPLGITQWYASRDLAAVKHDDRPAVACDQIRYDKAQNPPAYDCYIQIDD